MIRARLSLRARLPDRLRRACANGWTEFRRHGTPADCFLEGPAIAPDGSLWCVDISNGRLLRLDADGTWSVIVEHDGWPTGLKLAPDGTAYVTDNRLGLLSLAPGAGRFEVLVDRFRGEALLGVNDLALTPGGDICFTDQGASDLARPEGRVLRLARDGSLDLMAVGLPSPNGLAFAPAGGMLYIALTQANAIWRVMLRPDGGPGKLGHVIQLSGSLGGGPDGIAFDSAGRLFVCHALAGCVRVFDALGEPVARIDTAEGLIPTNLCFDPRRPGLLYVTEAQTGTIQTIDLEVLGLPEGRTGA
ncbi:SMP-30/gluconolactonase/LRE family protein [Falsiroseomonas ponticola]|uniref:SMP-30/gluconolactonase/LRE family protein n=1 Tax=Falsiroseomonas ponticola TaxID=2786951 RepID=UPI0019313E1F|nr:SMP-30/gluconolactonase/LRE family protein [Roseomonas ponticola]